ncbi:MAG: hypothetical protein Q7S82_00450 [bacterium]|nr:hypothetical protein [bacterium]
MDVLIWILAALLWLPAGYLGARLLNAFSGEMFTFDWQKPASNPQTFGLGIFFGGLTLAFAICVFSFFLFIFGLGSFLEIAITFLGHFAPRK